VIRFLAVGDLMLDVLVDGSGHAAHVAIAAGGSALNAAVCAAGLGADAAVAGRVGDDAPGRLLLAELAARGVRADVSTDAEARTGTFVLVDGDVRADRGANASYRPEHLPELAADAVLVSGYLPAGTVAAALVRARAPWVALDAGRLAEIPAEAGVVLANEAAARRLTGEDAEAAVRRLAAGRRLACVTLGADGAIAAWEGGIERAQPPDSDAPADVPGAGDAFAAALLVELARGAAVPEALGRACRAGAAAVAAVSAARTAAAR
jgi:ribokinase